MTKTSAKIVFFGNERLATGVTTDVLTLKALLREGYDVVAVVSHNESTNSRKQRTLEIAEVAKEHDIPVLLPAKPAEIIDELRAYNADIGVLVAYGKIVPQSVIDIFPHGIINIHPSALPLHRGPTPIESVILSGEKTTTVSVMQLAKEMDAGPVYAQDMPLPIASGDKQGLSHILLYMGSELLIKNLPAILDGSLEPTPQDASGATYDKLIEKKDGILDFEKDAEMLEREIRAYAARPKSRTTIAGVDVAITDAKVVPVIGVPGTISKADGKLLIACKKFSLQIEKLTPAGKNEMTAQAFLAGYGLLL